MINYLLVNNIVLIDKIEIDFSCEEGGNFIVFTGETGSGKSILLDALGLAIGYRSSNKLIGNYQDKSTVVAEFNIMGNIECRKILEENEILNSDNPNILNIRRILSQNSTNKIFVNDISISSNLLKAIGESLVEIHGQNDQRWLVNTNFHLEVLDNFAKNQTELEELNKIYNELKKIDEEIGEIKANLEKAKLDYDYHQYVINEILSAKIQSGEEEELTMIKNQLSGKEKINNFLIELKSKKLEISSLLINSEKLIHRNNQLIENYINSEIENFQQMIEVINSAVSNIDNSIDIIDKNLSQINNQEHNLEEIEERLFYLKSLARKYNCKIENLDNILENSKVEIKKLELNDQNFSFLENKREQLLKKYAELAVNLSQKRKKYAVILESKIEEELRYLNMPRAKFKISFVDEARDIDRKEYTKNGYDKVKFVAAINNEEFQELSKTASGGELSRFMLALKVALSDAKAANTIIFDEIDTGIGGKTSDAVGNRLKALSKNFQVIAVTHLPQIASKAGQNFKISKIFTNDKTQTIISKIKDDEKVEEIARMISGEKITKESIEAAKILIKN